MVLCSTTTMIQTLDILLGSPSRNSFPFSVACLQTLYVNIYCYPGYTSMWYMKKKNSKGDFFFSFSTYVNTFLKFFFDILSGCDLTFISWLIFKLAMQSHRQYTPSDWVRSVYYFQGSNSIKTLFTQ